MKFPDVFFALMLVLQPAEERAARAKAMLKDGLFKKLLPDAAIALHVSADLPAGKVAVKSGYFLANADFVDITVKGIGGHGAYPHKTVDPIILASRLVLALQITSSREVSPLGLSVVTVGSIHGGIKHNIIGDSVKLQLTLRSYSTDVRNQQIAAISRPANGIAMSAGLPPRLYPEITVNEAESLPSAPNTPALAYLVQGVLQSELGEKEVETTTENMAGEDSGLYGRTKEQIPVTMFWLGAINPKQYAQAKRKQMPLPSLHSGRFFPDYSLTIQTGVRSLSVVALAILNSDQR